VSNFWQDLRYASRIFAKRPGFAAATVLTLALGIGATTAIFSVVYGVVLKPLPFDQPDRLVAVRQYAPRGAGNNQGAATYLTYREHQRAFEAIGVWDPAAVSITGDGGPERVQALVVTSETLPLLRVQPVLGRVFSVEDDRPGAPPRVLLTFGYWQRRFAGKNDIIGQPLAVNGNQAEIIGVLPASFSFLRTRPAIVLPLPLDASAPRGISFGFQALARLKPGVTLAQANADAGRVISLFPPAFAALELQPNVRPLADEVIRDVRQILWILLAAVGVVLLIACGNVANLFLVRAEGRQHELAMRAALGASRGRITLTLLSESVVLAVASGAVGVALAQAATLWLRRLAPAELPRLDEIGIDAVVLLFTLGISVVSGLLFGLFAVLRFARLSVAAVNESGRSASDAPRRQRARNLLVVGQVALALTLLIVAGLMIRTFLAMRQVEPGFTRPEEVQTFVIAIPAGHVGDPPQVARTFEGIAERLAQVPGVGSVGLSSSVTMDGEDNGNPIEAEGIPLPPPGRTPGRRFKSVAPGYFETMGIRLVAGRSVSWRDIHDRQPVIMISRTLAQEYWGDPTRAIGKRIRALQRNAPWREIVGVVGDERDDGLAQPPTAIVYWPMLNENYPWRTMACTVRSPRVGAPGFLRELEDAVWSVDRNLPLANVRTLEEIQAQSMAQTSFALVMLSLAASVAILIGLVGIYGMVAYAATQRTREIGIRMALGAQAADVRRLFLRQGMSLTAVGIALGVGIAAVLTRVMSTFLFGVSPTDPATYAVVSGVLGGASLFATYLPARRASQVDPMVAIGDQAESRNNMWRAARSRVRHAIRDLTQPREQPSIATAALIRDLTGLIRRSASFADAQHVALTALRDRLGARSIVLLEKQSRDQYRGGDLTIPAGGILLKRLTHYLPPLPLAAGDFDAWQRWTGAHGPHRVTEIEDLRASGAGIAVALRSRSEIVGVLLLGPPEGRASFSDAEKDVLGSAAEIFALLIENARLNTRVIEQEKVRRDLALAAEVQRRLLPPKPPDSAMVTIAAFTLPARTVGGDYYDFLDLGSDRTAIAVADIAGKGIAAALLMSMVQASLRVISTDGDLGSAELATRLNRFLYQSTAANHYATFFYARLEGNRLRYVNAGHNPPHLVRRSESGVEIIDLTAGGTVLGLFPEVGYEDAEIELRSGDLFVAFTDGVPEARNDTGEEFGEERLQNLLRGGVGATAEEVSAMLAGHLRTWIAGTEQHDDLTFVVAVVK